MAFLKFRCDGPYATGAVKTTLDPKGLAFKLTRHNMPARMTTLGPCVDATCNGDRWSLNDWQREPDGGWIAWLRFTMQGDLDAFSRRLATHGVRHRLEWSQPYDQDTDHIRRVTRYSYRWDGLDRANKYQSTPDVERYIEQF